MKRWLARALGFVGFAPKRATRSAFEGAVSNRLTADWVHAPIASADQELRGDVQRLRARARELVRNNPHAARFVGMVAENVVGHHGVQLQATVTNAAGLPDIGINQRIERAWAEWSQPENASADGRDSWEDIQTLVAEGLAQDGEALIRLLPGFGNEFGFAVQVLDPDQLDHMLNRPAGDRENEIRMGVEVDHWGRPVAYHIWDRHPYDIGGHRRERIRIPAAQIIHLYRRRRPGQTRGVTWFAPVLLPLKMLDGYEEAELVAARTAAAKMGWLKQDPETAGLTQPDDNGPVTLDASPGSIETLPPGYSFESWDPQHPNAAFKDFVKAVLRGVAAGLGVSYNSLANDLESDNYSSIRAGLLSERDGWRRLQTWLARHLHRRVYREWLKWALTTGALELPSRNASRWHDARWLPRGWPWVDPLKDLEAAALAIRLGLDSRGRLAGEQGRDFEDVIAALAHEQAVADMLGVTLATDTTSAAPVDSAPTDEQTTG